eukprot:CAMPEP_0114548824 /NCGR_PEP_ID=MMETSP0114-20121206/5194_1 /TAXON_ID=31324 /ORGANISM="Goniomonas sp, Strain m" /LENGTH=159 /DNA_ID=CAMNT_0001733453 /DNA_START=21 /DNA_END=500 /DNA_ORIENTATION=-
MAWCAPSEPTDHGLHEFMRAKYPWTYIRLTLQRSEATESVWNRLDRAQSKRHAKEAAEKLEWSKEVSSKRAPPPVMSNLPEIKASQDALSAQGTPVASRRTPTGRDAVRPATAGSVGKMPSVAPGSRPATAAGSRRSTPAGTPPGSRPGTRGSASRQHL